MVSTRRSQAKGTDSEEDAAAATPTKTSIRSVAVSARATRTRGRQQKDDNTEPESGLSTIPEHERTQTPPKSAARHARLPTASPSKHASQDASQNITLTASSSPMTATQHAAGQRNDASSSNDDEPSSSGHQDSDDDAGSDLLPDTSELKASILAAFTSNVHLVQQQQQGFGASDDGPENDDQQKSDNVDVAMHWKPQVQLPRQKVPNRAVHQTSIDADKESNLSKQLLAPLRDPRLAMKAARKAAPESAGKKWFDLPATKIDDDMKRELRLLRLRGAYDPKRFYKSTDSTKFPKYFAVGTVMDSPTEFYSNRLSNAERKATLTQELLADSQLTQVRKKRYNKLQEEAQRYQKVKKRKTDLPRKKKSSHRPKH